MKLSYNWLKTWAPVELSAADAGEALTLAGLELEGIEAAAPNLDGVVVAEIISAERHPDADRLQVCQVNAGEETLQIVCGAPNARAGLKVALATIGTRLPGDFKIKKSKIRGQQSFGMLCSESELGLEGLCGNDGILELPSDWANGTPLSEALDLNDEVLEIALTPNRGDCFSVRGIARELACSQQSAYEPVKSAAQTVELSDVRSISIENAEDCSNYHGRVIKGLNRAAPTPLWMQERLRRADIRCINPLVDITNYVMLELGQPMHAFDLNKLQGDIQVRRSQAGEKLTLLNDQLIELSGEELLICDAQGPVALAGAMGGLDSSVDDETVDVFLESACFSPRAVAGTGRKFKLSSESLHRFERGVDPCLQELALERATQLLTEIAGGQAGPVCRCVAADYQAEPIRLRPERVCRLLGCDLDDAAMTAILQRLNCEVSENGEELSVLPPSHRYDLSAEIDLLEEIARIHGYDNLPSRTPAIPVALAPPKADAYVEHLRRAVVNRGYQEAISFSFADKKADDALSTPYRSAVLIDNPISSALEQMRRSLWASLLPVWKHNVARQQSRIRLFEIGRRYWKQGEAIQEELMLSGILSGLRQPEQWSAEKAAVDFYDLKADLLALFGAKAPDIEFSSEDLHPALHPGQAARLVYKGDTVGHMGVLHPALRKPLDAKQSPLLFEISCAALAPEENLDYQDIAETPSSRRDLAVLVNQSLEAGKLINHLKSRGGEILREVGIFDVFTGDALPKGFKSVALGLIFQDFSRTLTDEEVDTVMQRLISELEQEFGAQIRD